MERDGRLIAAARACHEANNAFCAFLGDPVSPPWEEAPDWMKDSAVKGVSGVMNGATPEQSHEAWMQDRIERGWVYGSVKDEMAKTHPCLVPYHALPPAQRSKDALFVTVAKAMLTAVGG